MLNFRCPNCDHGIEVEIDPADPDAITCPTCNSRFDFAQDLIETVAPQKGERIGHFEVMELLGEGAFGTVHAAYDTELQRTVAIKVPREGRFTQDTLKEFYREARAASAVHHTNVVGVLEIGTHEGRPYIVTELVNGVSLSHWLAHHEADAQTTAGIMQSICEGVHAAHRFVIHRDLKPGNILLDDQLVPHVADFGLAKSTRQGSVTVTRQGALIGTLAYMSPEQARGDVQNLDVRSDVYALGVTLYEMLTKKRPFKATDSRSILYQIQTEEPSTPRSIDKTIPRDLETIALHAMHKDPARRYPTAAEMALDLGRFLEGQPIHARPVSPAEKAWLWAKRNRPLAAAVCCIVLLLSVTGALIARQALADDSTGVVNATAPSGEEVLEGFPVEISCRLPEGVSQDGLQADWVIAPLDDDRQPDVAKVVRERTESLELTTRLSPGEYAVVVEVSDVGFHEVIRLVPKSLTDTSGTMTPNQFKVREGTVVLPPVQIFDHKQAIDGLAFIEGGTYEAGKLKPDGQPDSMTPPTDLEIAAFYIQRTEVTYDDYVKVRKQPRLYLTDTTIAKGNHPIVGVNFYMAAHYAEAIGCRLITEFEWEYAATNRGQSKEPWTTDFTPEPRWQFLPVGQPKEDVTPLTGIYGLHTNAAELTSSPLRPIGTGIMRGESRVDDYVYKGGPQSREVAFSSKRKDSLRDRRSIPQRGLSGDYVSFRCVRSERPMGLPPEQ